MTIILLCLGIALAVAISELWKLRPRKLVVAPERRLDNSDILKLCTSAIRKGYSIDITLNDNDSGRDKLVVRNVTNLTVISVPLGAIFYSELRDIVEALPTQEGMPR